MINVTVSKYGMVRVFCVLLLPSILFGSSVIHGESCQWSLVVYNRFYIIYIEVFLIYFFGMYALYIALQQALFINIWACVIAEESC